MILNDDEDELRFKTIAADSDEETEFGVKVKVGYKGMPSEIMRAYKRIILEHKRVFAFDESEVGRINGYCYDMLFKSQQGDPPPTHQNLTKGQGSL